ncbi:MAG: glycosyltransferase family 39 protein [Candidatus Wallbacteria bacterium]|nr:glycosyltransferase family 39 protein [Candidatus Wallbacteria bacterium]
MSASPAGSKGWAQPDPATAWSVLAAALAAGVLARISNLPFHLTRLMNSDAALFLNEARSQLAGGPGLDPLWPPLYPLAAAALAGKGGDLETAALGLSLAAGALAPIALFLLGRALAGARVAEFSAVGTALLAPLVFWSCQAYPETLFILTLYSLLSLFWHIRSSPSPAPFFLAGMLAGAAYLLRPEGFVYGPMLALWTAVHRPEGQPARTRWRAAAALAAGFALLATPYLARLRAELGHLSVSGKAGWNLLVGGRALGEDYDRLAWSLTPDGKEIACRRAMRELTLGKVLLQKPAELGRRYAVNSWRLAGQLVESLGWVTSALVGVGIVALAAEPAVLLLLGVACAPLAALPLFFIDGRFVVFALPALLLLAGVGLERSAALVSSRQSTRRLAWMLLAAAALVPHALAAAAVASAAPAASQAVRAGEEYRQVGTWMRLNCPPESKTTHVWTAYHAGLQSVQIPFGSYSEVLRYLRSQGCNYLVVDKRNAARGWLPESTTALSFLLQTDRPPLDLEEVHCWKVQPEYEVRVYRLKKVEGSSQ